MIYLRQACSDTFSGLLRPAILAMLGFAISFVAYVQILGWEAAMDEFHVWWISAVGSAGAVFLFFLWNLACSPYRVENGKRKASEKRMAELDHLDEILTAQAIQRKRINRLLGALMKEGRELFSSEGASDPEEFRAEIQRWGVRTNTVILRAFGEGESELFLSNSGLSPLEHSYVRDRKNYGRAAFLDQRLRRLSELVQRVPSLTINDGFDVARWDSRSE